MNAAGSSPPSRRSNWRVVTRRLFTCFVSSTFEDLKDERQRLVRVLLRNECVPFGMEFFPSAGRKQWPIIVDAIEAADFCLFVVAGRYGSISDEPPLSWTHREFRKAVSLEKPIAAMLHKSPRSLPLERCDRDPQLATALSSFRDEIENETVCAYYEDEADLVEGVSTSIRTFRESGQLTGWVRANDPTPSRPSSRSAAQPTMSVSVVGATPPGALRLEAATERPWPVDDERVVANALHDARKESEAVRNGPDLSRFLGGAGLAGAVGHTPTKEDREAAWQTFEQKLQQYELGLREWLVRYREACHARANRFVLTLEVLNELGGAHADDVELMITLPDTLTRVVEEPEPVVLPPSAPRYRPPIRRSGALAGMFGDAADIPRPIPWALPNLDTALAPLRTVTPRIRWNKERTQARISAGSLYMGRSEILDPIQLQASEPGSHHIACAIYSKSLAAPVEAAIELFVPHAVPNRPAFGRIGGILEYPDVDLVDESGDLKHEARTSDPPVDPPPPAEREGESVLGTIGDFFALSSWQALGLDPQGDLGASDARIVPSDD